jgi:hypothetical protein
LFTELQLSPMSGMFGTTGVEAATWLQRRFERIRIFSTIRLNIDGQVVDLR